MVITTDTNLPIVHHQMTKCEKKAKEGKKKGIPISSNN